MVQIIRGEAHYLQYPPLRRGERGIRRGSSIEVNLSVLGRLGYGRVAIVLQRVYLEGTLL